MRFKVYDPNHHDIHLDHLGLSYARIRQDCAMKYTQWDQSQSEVAFFKHPVGRIENMKNMTLR